MWVRIPPRALPPSTPRLAPPRVASCRYGYDCMRRLACPQTGDARGHHLDRHRDPGHRRPAGPSRARPVLGRSPLLAIRRRSEVPAALEVGGHVRPDQFIQRQPVAARGPEGAARAVRDFEYAPALPTAL